MQKFLRDTTPTLVSYPRVSATGQFLRRVPTSVTVRVKSPANASTSYAAGTVDSVSTTVSGAHAEGSDHLSLASVSGITARRRYLVAISGDENLDVEIRRSGSPVGLAEPLQRAVANSAAFSGWACSIALTAEQTEEIGYGSARFKAVIDSVTYEWDETFRVVHRLLAPTLTPTRLTQAFPQVVSLKPKKDHDLEETIRLAWEHEVIPWLELSGFEEEYVQSVEALEPLHALACVLMLARPNPAFSREVLQDLERMWTHRTQTTAARASWYAAPPTTEPSPTPEGGAPEIPLMFISR
jgi:hypothetical protein